MKSFLRHVVFIFDLNIYVVLLSVAEHTAITDAEKKERQKNDEESLRHIFGLVDADGSGTIDQDEMLSALRDNEEVKEYVSKTTCLKPFLSDDTFAKAFAAMDTDDEAGVSLDEFLEFCSIVSEVSELNNGAFQM
jgi:Ca2+-binding EF-hand superfamily protein